MSQSHQYNHQLTETKHWKSELRNYVFTRKLVIAASRYIFEI